MRILLSMVLCLTLAGCVFDSKTMKFKFLSAGQNIEDAAVIIQTFQGNSLKPLAPVNLRMYRGLGAQLGGSPPINAGNLGFEWTRRARIGAGMRPGSDVPIAEEIARYEVEIMNGSDVVRTITVYPNDPEPILWSRLAGAGGGGFSTYADDSIATGSVPNAGVQSLSWSQQVFNVGSDDITISFVTKSGETGVGTNSLSYRVGLIPETIMQAGGNVRTTWFPTVGFQRAIGSSTEQTLGLFSDYNLTEATPTNLVIKVNRSGRVSLYQDPLLDSGILGPSTILLPPGRYRFFQRDGDTTLTNNSNEFEILRAMAVREDVPSCVYYLQDLLADFGGSAPSTLTIRVYQVSAIVGRGAFTEATFTL